MLTSWVEEALVWTSNLQDLHGRRFVGIRVHFSAGQSFVHVFRHFPLGGIKRCVSYLVYLVWPKIEMFLLRQLSWFLSNSPTVLLSLMQLFSFKTNFSCAICTICGQKGRGCRACRAMLGELGEKESHDWQTDRETLSRQRRSDIKWHKDIET